MASQQQIVVFFFCDSTLSVVPKRLCSGENIAPGCNVVVQWRDKTTGTRDLEAVVFFLAESTKAANEFVRQIYSRVQDYVKAGENVQGIYNEICNADKDQSESNKENRQRPASKEKVVTNVGERPKKAVTNEKALQQRSNIAAVAQILELRRSPLQEMPSTSSQAQIPANSAPPQEPQTAPPCPPLEAPQQTRPQPQFETPPRIELQHVQQQLTTPAQIPLQPARPQFTTPPQIPRQPAQPRFTTPPRPHFETPPRIALQRAQQQLTTPAQIPLQPAQPQFTTPPQIPRQPARPQFTTPPQIPRQPAQQQLTTPPQIPRQPAQQQLTTPQMPLQPTQLPLTLVPPTILQQYAMPPQLMSLHEQPMYTQYGHYGSGTPLAQSLNYEYEDSSSCLNAAYEALYGHDTEMSDEMPKSPCVSCCSSISSLRKELSALRQDMENMKREIQDRNISQAAHTYPTVEPELRYNGKTRDELATLAKNCPNLKTGATVLLKATFTTTELTESSLLGIHSNKKAVQRPALDKTRRELIESILISTFSADLMSVRVKLRDRIKMIRQAHYMDNTE